MTKWQDRDSSIILEDREDIIFEDTEPSSSYSSSESSRSSSSSSESSKSSATGDLFIDDVDVWKSTLYDLWKKEGAVVLPPPTGLRIIP